jgi:hypothetical protein
MEETEVFFEGESKRSKLLQTICILSFIMCGIMILTGLWGIKSIYMPSANELAQQAQQMKMLEKMNPEFYQTALEMNESKGLSSIASLIAQVLSLFGVMMMWKLKKTGFYIYLMAEILPYAVTLILSGPKAFLAMAGMFGDSMQTVFYIIIALSFVIDIGFMILYGLESRKMT